MKKTARHCALLLFLLLPAIALTTYAHQGRTDGSGGHTDHSTGEYHYHHGYPAHDHYDIDGDGDIDCPYNFDDQTNHKQSGENHSTNKVTQPTVESTDSQAKESGKTNSSRFKIVLQIVIAIVVIGFWLLPIFFKK